MRVIDVTATPYPIESCVVPNCWRRQGRARSMNAMSAVGADRLDRQHLAQGSPQARGKDRLLAGGLVGLWRMTSQGANGQPAHRTMMALPHRALSLTRPKTTMPTKQVLAPGRGRSHDDGIQRHAQNATDDPREVRSSSLVSLIAFAFPRSHPRGVSLLLGPRKLEQATLPLQNAPLSPAPGAAPPQRPP